jgi:hypothetical protein
MRDNLVDIVAQVPAPKRFSTLDRDVAGNFWTLVAPERQAGIA